MSLFRPEIGRALRIPVRNGHGQVIKLARGRLKATLCRVNAQMDKVRFPVFIGFSRGRAASFNIIGRQGFFERFGVYFNESKHRVGLAVRK